MVAGGGGGDSIALIDTIEDESAPIRRSRSRQTEVKEALAEAISELPEREKLVVTLYYYEELTLREIGEVLGVTESRVSQLHTKAILRLKAHLSGAPASPPRRRESPPRRALSGWLRRVRSVARLAEVVREDEVRGALAHLHAFLHGRTEVDSAPDPRVRHLVGECIGRREVRAGAAGLATLGIVKSIC